MKAATLTITDTFGGSNTVWTLDVATGCLSCSITLTANFQDPAGADTNAYTGSFVDSVQWLIGGADPTGITVNTAPGGNTNWAGQVDKSLSSGQCNGNATDATCVQFTGVGAAGGFGPIVNGSTLTWTFTETFATALPSTLTTGNIRAGFNNSEGDNYNVFSPGGGTFGQGGTGGGTGAGGGSGQPLVPEPTSLLLFGSGLSMAAYRARRKKQNEKKN